MHIKFSKLRTDNFWARVDKKPTGCWEWTGAKRHTGYGFVRYKKAQVQAHRVSWSLTNGEIPEGMFICHKCDNPICVNPDHLFCGTAGDNTRDMHKKGRASRLCGEANPTAKLTKEHVQYIREHRGIKTGKELAKQFHVSPKTISKIQLYQRWK